MKDKLYCGVHATNLKLEGQFLSSNLIDKESPDLVKAAHYGWRISREYLSAFEQKKYLARTWGTDL